MDADKRRSQVLRMIDESKERPQAYFMYNSTVNKVAKRPGVNLKTAILSDKAKESVVSTAKAYSKGRLSSVTSMNMSMDRKDSVISASERTIGLLKQNKEEKTEDPPTI